MASGLAGNVTCLCEGNVGRGVLSGRKCDRARDRCAGKCGLRGEGGPVGNVACLCAGNVDRWAPSGRKCGHAQRGCGPVGNNVTSGPAGNVACLHAGNVSCWVPSGRKCGHAWNGYSTALSLTGRLLGKRTGQGERAAVPTGLSLGGRLPGKIVSRGGRAVAKPTAISRERWGGSGEVRGSRRKGCDTIR